MLVMAAVNGFFSGRGQTWTVLGIEAFGTAVNVVLALVLIFGRLGFPEMGIDGAGWATVAGSWASRRWSPRAVPAAQVPRRSSPRCAGWRPERELFGRLMKYGGPAGMQVFLDVLVFNVFVQLVGRLGEAATGATTLTVRLNMIAFLPMMGLGQAVCILVGQRLGADRPRPGRAESPTPGCSGSSATCACVAAIYLLFPDLLVSLFEGDRDPEELRGDRGDRAEPAGLRGGLLAGGRRERDVRVRPSRGRRHAVRDAADVRLAWPIMVMPTYSGRQARRQRLLGVGVRHRVHLRDGGLLLPALPAREVEDACA